NSAGLKRSNLQRCSPKGLGELLGSRWRMRPTAAAEIGDGLNDVEEDGGEEDAKNGDADHAGENGDAESAAHLGAGAFTDDQGNDAEDEGQRGHHDGTQAEAAGFECGLKARHAGDVPGAGKF